MEFIGKSNLIGNIYDTIILEEDNDNCLLKCNAISKNKLNYLDYNVVGNFRSSLDSIDSDYDKALAVIDYFTDEYLDCVDVYAKNLDLSNFNDERKNEVLASIKEEIYNNVKNEIIKEMIDKGISSELAEGQASSMMNTEEYQSIVKETDGSFTMLVKLSSVNGRILDEIIPIKRFLLSSDLNN